MKKTQATLQTYLKRFKRWNLILVRNDGHTISLGDLKVAAAAIIALVIAVTLSITFHMRYTYVSQEIATLQKVLKRSQSETSALRKEKEALMVSLVLAETMQQNGKSGSQKSVAQKAGQTLSPQKESQGGADQKTASLSGDLKEQARGAQNGSQSESSAASTAPLHPKQVDIDNFSIKYSRMSAKVRAKFKIIKADETIRQVAGYAFVVLKTGDETPDEWVAMPAGELADGRPARVNIGLSFSIIRFKTMRFERAFSGKFERFRTATVLVYDPDGRLLMEKDVSING